MKLFKEFLNEKWTVDITIDGFGQPTVKKTVPIYENPSSTDLVQLAKDGLSSSNGVRFLSIPSLKKVFVWSAEKSLHDPTLFQLQKNKKVPAKININRIDLVLGGLAKLKNGELVYDPSVIDVDLSELIDFAKVNKPLPATRIPPPYKTVDEFKTALPELEKSYRFTADYLSEFLQTNPFIRLIRALKLRTL